MSDKALQIARERILGPSGLEDNHLIGLLARLSGPDIDYSDLYFQHSRHESWVLEDGIVKEGTHSIDQGVGVRAVSGEKTGFAYSDEILLPALTQASDAARAIARSGGSGKVQAWQSSGKRQLYSPADPVDSLEDKDKIAFLEAIDRTTRAIDQRVQQVIASISGLHELVLVVGSDGTLSADIRPLVRLNISVILEQDGQREQGYGGIGGRYDYRQLFAGAGPDKLAHDVVRQASMNLEAKPAPAGTMTVVLGPGWPGVLLHEAIGHGLEGDFNRKGTSAFSGRIGERVANELCTVVDDGTLDGRRGSLNMDDEGTPTQRNILIENGVLVSYLQDKLNARLMGMESTGNGRRESYAHAPMPRMTNTFMLPGPHEHEEIIASVEKGIYASNFAGGQVDITSGKFVFSANEAWLIEKGRLTTPIKGATLIGNGPDVLTRVSMVGNNLQLDGGVGVCGKDGQSIPVGVGQPTLRIDGLTVGGTG
ncbi:MAG: metalloprotease TldD [Gammaproteobacteria bacterium]|nr:metalloprotease TldD [Gammaproteobacteria bacterium]